LYIPFLCSVLENLLFLFLLLSFLLSYFKYELQWAENSQPSSSKSWRSGFVLISVSVVQSPRRFIDALPIIHIIPVPWSCSSVDSWSTPLNELDERFAISALFLELPIITHFFRPPCVINQNNFQTKTLFTAFPLHSSEYFLSRQPNIVNPYASWNLIGSAYAWASESSLEYKDANGHA
jgi:hypothetical protein